MDIDFVRRNDLGDDVAYVFGLSVAVLEADYVADAQGGGGIGYEVIAVGLEMLGEGGRLGYEHFIGKLVQECNS